ncbi:MAG TPA: acylphosphatase [Stellaceae bacterium]|nr:acylphosphatase [Stellaceae bacterium]
MHLAITGRVQGVGFRAFVMAEARARGLRGWVRNRRDGSVEALVIGEADEVAAMIERCKRGPRAARVDRVETAPAADDGGGGFSAYPTV